MKAKIEHIALYTPDLERMKRFYEDHFGATSGAMYHHGEFSSYFLTFADGARLEIMSHEALEMREALDRVSGLSHIAFSLGGRQEVIELTDRLVADGCRLLSPPRTTGDGYFESCVADPDGNRVELTV